MLGYLLYVFPLQVATTRFRCRAHLTFIQRIYNGRLEHLAMVPLTYRITV